MKIYKSITITIKLEKEKFCGELCDRLTNNTIFINWKHEKKIINQQHSIIIEVIEYEKDDRFDGITEFIKLLKDEKKIIDKFKDVNYCFSLKHDIEYDDQCNMEFHPQELKKLSDNEIVLCISCWQK